MELISNSDRQNSFLHIQQKFAVLFLVIPFFLTTARAWSLEVPTWNGPVNDEAGIISTNQERELTSYLQGVNDQTGVQMAVLTVRSLEGESLESYSMQVAEAWKLGQKGKDNGALLIVALNEHKIRIEVGYGLEDKLTDIKCGLITRTVITPYFKNGRYGDGIRAGINNMVGIATDNQQIVSESVLQPKEERDNSDAIVSILFLIIFFGIITSGIGRRSGLFGWLPWFWLFNGSSHSHHIYTGHDDHNSGFGGFGGGGFSGSGGGFGGGGFSGGGGGFGGGGASGGW
jgi:uncharacterized protein